MKEAHITKDCHKKAVKLAHKCSIWLKEAEEMTKSAANEIFHWVVYCLQPQKYQVHCIYPTHKLKNYVQIYFNLKTSIFNQKIGKITHNSAQQCFNYCDYICKIIILLWNIESQSIMWAVKDGESGNPLGTSGIISVDRIPEAPNGFRDSPSLTAHMVHNRLVHDKYIFKFKIVKLPCLSWLWYLYVLFQVYPKSWKLPFALYSLSRWSKLLPHCAMVTKIR